MAEQRERGQARDRQREQRGERVAGGGGSRKDTRLIFIDTEARDRREFIDEGKGRSDIIDGMGSESKIICEGKSLETRERTKIVEKGVISDDKEEGAQRAALFDPSKNVDPMCNEPAKEGSHLDMIKGRSDKVDKPERGSAPF